MITHDTIGTPLAKVELGENYLDIKGALSDRELSEVFRSLSRMQGASLWWIGDFLNSAATTKGEAYAKAYLATDYAPATLWEAKSVCGRIPKESRVNLSYSHHKEALGIAKDTTLAIRFLKTAEQEGLSVKQLRKTIIEALGERQDRKVVATKTIIDSESVALDNAFSTIRNFLANTTSTTFDMKKRNVLAELETLAEMAKEVCG